MKNKFFTLLKADLKALTVGRLTGKDGSKKIWLLALVGLMFVYIMVACTLQFWTIFDLAKTMGAPELGFMFAGISIISLLLFLTMAEAQDKLYKAKDLPTLVTLPLKEKHIFFSKAVAILLTAYMYFSLVYFPLMISYFISFGFNTLGLFYGLLLFFVIPLFPSTIGILVGRLISGLAKNKKHRGILSAIIYGIILIVYMGAIFIFMIFLEDIFSNPSILKVVTTVLYPFTMIAKSMEGDFVSFIILFLSIIAIAVSLIFIASFGYLKIMRAYRQETVKEKKVEFQKRSQFVTFFKKEARKYFSSGIYVFNTIFGVVLAVVATIAVMFVDVPIEEGISVAAMMPMIYVAFTALSCTTAVSISLEGKNFYSLKALPVNQKMWLNAKSALNMVLVSPVMVLSASIFFIYSGEWITLLFTILLIVVMNGFTAEWGLFANILAPKFEFPDDTAVVKRSLSTVIGVFVPMVIYGTVEYLLSLLAIGSIWVWTIEVLLFAMFAVGLFMINRSYGIKRLAKL